MSKSEGRAAMRGERLAERLALGLFMLILLAGAWLAVRPQGLPARAATTAREAGEDAVPPSPPPPVEPLEVAQLAPEQAKASNDQVPFVSGPIPAARPFVLTGSPLDRERALACLSAAVLYEAGDDPVGQAAVAQVVLNRVRHPAFPKSICGVVFQGAERQTGCQFTFTCDGALARSYAPATWLRAKAVAARALNGQVFKKVGTATHYHTDWVVPYWSASLDKLAAVDTHLFFRWQGWWGTPAAFRGRYSGVERLDPRIAYLVSPEARALDGMTPPGDATTITASEADGTLVPPQNATVKPVEPAVLGRSTLRLADYAKGQFVLQLDPAVPSGAYAGLALGICRGRNPCTVLGWIKPEVIPAKLPITPANRQSLSFFYFRATAGERDQALWHCRQFKRPDPAQCLPGTGVAEVKAKVPAAPAPVPTAEVVGPPAA